VETATDNATRPRGFNAPISRYTRWRMMKNAVAARLIAAGGISVIIFICLIFFYLAYVVVPLFEPAQVRAAATYRLEPAPGEPLYWAIEEQTEIGVRFSRSGEVLFFDTENGTTVARHQIALPEEVRIASFANAQVNRALVAFGLTDGRAILARHQYHARFRDDIRTMVPELRYPYGEEPLVIDPEGQPLVRLAVQEDDDAMTLIAQTADQRLLLVHFTKETNFLDESVSLERQETPTLSVSHQVDHILLSADQNRVFLVANDGTISFLDIRDKSAPSTIEQTRLFKNERSLQAIAFLTGYISLIVADDSGTIGQWSLVRNQDNVTKLQRIREFRRQSDTITAIATEPSRKGFLTVDRQGELAIYHATAHRVLFRERLFEHGLQTLAIAPRANAAIALDETGMLHFVRIRNEHPEISWSALWGKVWYEGYPEPRYVWQSSSASDDFEPKFSLVPLTFGTLKAAFYALLLAAPLALLGALYTAQFMAPQMRTMVKPAIEIMEALPTVILGFLAGLWLAPYVENHLPGVIAVFVLLPVGLLVCAYAWTLLPDSVRHIVPDGWEAALLVPVIIGLIALAMFVSPQMELWLFGGDVRTWLTHEMGVGFDQRNAIVVGLAMGFAVIPTIFSIAEDALYAVPKHLVQGSLALGATAWQTMTRVVILTASPGIFSALMIGLGRAVGETMIVLMATGNTPVMNFSPFEGLRTLSANIAVELPESEVNSTHFRVLFLAGLVLFLFTFLVNSAAEIVRQRLRKKYSTL